MVVLTTPRYSTLHHPSVVGVRCTWPIATIATTDSTNAVTICTQLRTVARYRCTNRPVKKIWKAKPTAHSSDSASPKPSVILPFNESTATPTTDKQAPSTPRHPTRLRSTRKAMNGTITTFNAVRNAFLDGVVYCRPIICSAKAANSAMPISTPAPISLRLMFRNSRTLIKLISTAPSRNRMAMICMGVRLLSAISLATNPPPQIAVTTIRPATAIPRFMTHPSRRARSRSRR